MVRLAGNSTLRLMVVGLLIGGVPGLHTVAAREPDADLVRAASLGPIVDAPDGKSEMELVRFDDRLAAELQALAPEESVRVEDWPVAPGRREPVVLRRFDVYAPDAKIVVVEDGRETEAPRSPTVFFMGSRVDGSSRFAVGLDPETGTFRGTLQEGGTAFEIRPQDDGSGIHRLAARAAFENDETPPRSWACGQEELPLDDGLPPSARAASVPEMANAVVALAPATRVAVIAVETDNELLNLKFGNNTADATTYLANLFVALNVIYERDVNLRLLQGYTILRPSTTADPYEQSGTGNADSAKLTELRTYWNAQYGTVKRTLTMMLSGKQASGNSASGIAYVNVLCGVSGYSFTQVFKFAEQTAGNDVGVVAHEIGHNMASPHTHCYASPKPDTCYAGESCYSGATACPTQATYNGVAARGTLMSYCHILGGCSKADVYHPDSLSRYVNGAVASASSCIFSIGAAAPTISNVSPSTGPLAGGTSVTITGAGFVNGATVAFVEVPPGDAFGTPSARAPAGSVVFNGATQLTVTTPAASSTGAVDVVVMNPDFQTATRSNGFTYQNAPPPPPALNAIGSPVVVGGLVTLTGSGFTGGTVIKMFVSTASSPVDTNGSGWAPTTQSPTQLTWNVPATIPLGQGYGTFLVVNTDQAYAQSNTVGQLLYGDAADNIPTVTAVNGTALGTSSLSVPVAHADTVVGLGSTVTLTGTGFSNALVNLYTATGNVGPLTPLGGATSTQVRVVVPGGAPVGPGTFQVVNAPYTGNVLSNSVAAVLGSVVTITGVDVSGNTVTVNGTGFCALTVVNLFSVVGGNVVNLGGLNPNGSARIPLTIVNPGRFTFQKPAGASAGPAFVQALNPPYTTYSTSGADPDGAFSMP